MVTRLRQVIVTIFYCIILDYNIIHDVSIVYRIIMDENSLHISHFREQSVIAHASRQRRHIRTRHNMAYIVLI